MFSGSWDAASVKEALGDNMGCAQLPTITINGEAKQLKSFAGSKCVGVNKQTKNMKAAMDLAAFLANVDSQKMHYEMRGIIPAATALASDAAVKANIVAVAEANTMANTSVAQPVIPEMGNYWTPAGTMGGAIANGDVTEDIAAEQTELFQESLNKTGL
jgi:arabinogalactan oligomer/maltooligosaccharide transport system substrate-binding protein